MPLVKDGPASELFAPVDIRGKYALNALGKTSASKRALEVAGHAQEGDCVLWGIPFRIGKIHVFEKNTVHIPTKGLKTKRLVFLHVSDWAYEKKNKRLEKTIRKPRYDQSGHCP